MDIHGYWTVIMTMMAAAASALLPPRNRTRIVLLAEWSSELKAVRVSVGFVWDQEMIPANENDLSVE